MAIAGVCVGAAFRFGLLTWLAEDKHPARPVLEALSWIAGIGALVVALRQDRNLTTSSSFPRHADAASAPADDRRHERRNDRSSRWRGVPAAVKSRKQLLISMAGMIATLGVAASIASSCQTQQDIASAPLKVAGISCEIESGPVVLAISGRQGSPGFSMSSTTAQVVQAAIFRRNFSEPVTYVNVDGLPSVVGRRATTPLEPAADRFKVPIEEIAGEAAKVRARVPEVDVLSALDASARAAKPVRSGTIIMFDSGLSTAGGVNFDDETSIDVAADDMIEHLNTSGYLPDLSGMTVIFVGLGEVNAPQRSLRPAQRRHLAVLWKQIAHAAGAKCADTLDEIGHPTAPGDVPPVRQVAVPPPPTESASSGNTSVILSASGELQFRSDSADFEDEEAAKKSLTPVLRLIAAHPERKVNITGTTARIGSRDIQLALSKARAEAVARLLGESGVSEDRIITSGVGSEFREYIPDHGPDGRLLPGPAQQNRTVRIDLVAP
ncbi:OmpA family protein [Amycolatopsis sp. NPDC098790]|uniref:OmpA family protein n=1 Tax=Amycolatopsis sp. NPDC098790 TaxID=3363939 RepID=UPI0037F1D50B